MFSWENWKSLIGFWWSKDARTIYTKERQNGRFTSNFTGLTPGRFYVMMMIKANDLAIVRWGGLHLTLKRQQTNHRGTEFLEFWLVKRTLSDHACHLYWVLAETCLFDVMFWFLILICWVNRFLFLASCISTNFVAGQGKVWLKTTKVFLFYLFWHWQMKQKMKHVANEFFKVKWK